MRRERGAAAGCSASSPTPDHRVFLLWIIDTSEDGTLTNAQDNPFKGLTTGLKQALAKCRQSVILPRTSSANHPSSV